MISLRTLFSMVSATASLFLRMPFGQRLHRIRAALDDQLDQRQVVEGRDLLALLGPDVGVEQVPHGRLVHLEVDVVAAGSFTSLAHVLVDARPRP